MRVPKLEKSNSDFFDKISAWEGAEKVADIFADLLREPITMPPQLFHSRIYRGLVDHLIEWLGLPHSQGAVEWEWRELYQLELEINPQYFNEKDIHNLLKKWEAISLEKRQVMVTVLAGYFSLKREGFPSNFPSRLLPNSDCLRWVRIFPEEWSWESLKILRRVGLATMTPFNAFRMYTRLIEGVFEPDKTLNNMIRWQAMCWESSHLLVEENGEELSPYLASFMVSGFSNLFGALGIRGYCGDIPECEECPMSDDCQWNNSDITENPSAKEIQAITRKRQTEFLTADRLLQGLFDINEEERGLVQQRIAGFSLRQLAAMRHAELQAWLEGVNLPVEKLHLLFELCKRFNEERLAVGVAFRSPWDIFKHFRIRMRDLKQEQFIVVLLDNKKRYLGDQVVTQGTLDASPVHPREVFNVAIRESASSLLIVHNHPSGDPTPSQDDIEVTHKLMQAGELMGIPVLDHIIIADDRYTSLREQGLLKIS